ncbi:MAG: B12-binding domain-containing protein [Candidatus Thorarchaeota archaeon]
MSLEEKIEEAMVAWDEENLKNLCKSSIENGDVEANELLRIIGRIMRKIGKLFEEEEIFLPDLIGSANVVKNVIDDFLDPIIRSSGDKRETLGRIVLGTVEGDVHSIGKDLVAAFLFSNGFEVLNLGEEVPPAKYIEEAEEFEAQIIGLSSLLTMSMDIQRQVIEELKKKGLRDKYKVIIGGSPTSEEWAEEIGADGWADDAIEAVELAKKLLPNK